MLTTAQAVLERARELAKKRKPIVAVAGADDIHVLEAMKAAHEDGIAGAILVGSAAKIRAKMNELQMDPSGFEVLDADGVKPSVARAVEMCSLGKAHVLQKGKVPTPDLMRALLNPKAGLRQGRLLSHCAVMEVEGYPKLLTCTDGGVVVAPDFHQKLAIVENAVRLTRLLGVKEPRVALLGAVDAPDPDIPSSVEAAAVARACVLGGITPYAEGPLTMGTVLGKSDNIHWHSGVVGEPDILVSHAIEETNIGLKSLIYFRNATMLGVITGAKVPLSVVSRADPPHNKLVSLALAVVMAGEEV